MLLTTVWATVCAQQPVTLALSNRDPTGTTAGYFDGNILQVGNQYGGASIFAKFGGNGTKSFTVYSPGDGKNIDPVTKDGFFNFKPNGSMGFDKGKILFFSGSTSNISGSVAIKAIPLIINTYIIVGPAEVKPGDEVTIRYQANSSGTFPDGLKFIVELTDAKDTFLKYLANPIDGNNSSESSTYTQGDFRYIRATIPSDLAAGNYKVRVVTSGLLVQAPAYSSAAFSIKTVSQVVTQPTAINVTSVCPGGQIILSANVTDDGLLGVRENATDGGKYWVSYYNASTNQLALDFKTYNDEYTGTVTKQPSGQYTASNKIAGPITIPSSLPPGNYYVKIFVGEQNNRLNPNNAGNSPVFTVKAPATVIISDAVAGGVTINPGQAAAVKLTLGGDGVFTFNYDDLRNPGFSQTVSVLTAGSTTINVYPTSTYTFDVSKLINFRGACDNGVKSGQAVIKVNALTVKTTSATPSAVCPNVNPIVVAFTVSAIPPSGTKFLVQISDKNGNFQALSTSAEQDGNLIGSGTQSPIMCSIGRPISTYSPGTNYKVRVISENGSVQPDGSSATVTLSRPDKPTVSDISYCENAATISLKTGVSEGDLFWYQIKYNGGDYGSYTVGQNQATPPPSPTTPGVYTYQVIQKVSGCDSELAELKVTVKAKSSSPGNQTVDFCQLTGSQTLTINAQNPIWYTSTGASIGSTAPTINTDNASPQIYKVTQNSNGCVSDQSTITVNIKPKPGLPTVNTPAAICQFGQSVALVATGVSGSSLQWFDSDDKPISTPSPNTDGTNPINYKVTQTVNGCTSDKFTVTQTFNPASDKPIFTPGFYCVGYPAEPLSARTQTQGPKWYLSGSEIPATTVPLTTEVKVFTYQLTQTQADKKGCPSKPVDVTISVLATPVAPSVQSRGLCNNRPPNFTLDSLVSGQQLKWYDAATGGTGSSTTPKPDVGVIGPKAYYVTQTNAGNCESPRATLTLTVYPIPAAPKGIVSGPICQTSNQAQPVGPFTATADTGGTLTWYWFDRLGGSPQPPTTSATAQPGTYTVAVAQTVNGCISTTTVIPQTINKAPDKPTGADLLLCVKDVARPLSASPAMGNSLRWYGQSEKDGTASTQPPQATPDRVKTEIYYVSQVDGNGCESLLPRLAIKLTVADTPPAPTIPSVTTACQNTNPITLMAGATASLIWKGTDIQDTTKAPTPPTSTDRVFSYTVTQKLGSCISPASVFAYTIIKEPDVPAAQTSYQVCIGQTLSLSATASPATNTLKWYTSQLDATNRANAQPQVNVPTDKGQTLNWYVTQTDPHGCQSKTVGQTVTVSPQSTAKLTGDDRVVYDDNLHSQDSTAIRIQFGGAGPWNVTFWDGKSTVVAVEQNPFVKWVYLKDYAALTPVNSQTTASFALQALSGQCGAGSLVGATYTLTVQRLVTDIEPLQAGLSLDVLPNPVATTLRVEWQAVSRQGVMLRVVSSSGSVIWQASRVGSGVVQRESLPVSDWSAGQYYVQLAGESGTLAVRKLIKQ